MRRFTVSLTLAEANLVNDALSQLGTSQSPLSDDALALRARIHRSLEKQLKPVAKPTKKRPGKADAMFKRLPGSFESTR